MTINTEFSIGEEFYFLSKKTNKIICGQVYRIDVQYDQNGDTKVQYWHKHVVNSVEYEIINEIFCFKTQEELINSLIN